MTQLWIALAGLGLFAALVLVTLWRIRSEAGAAPEEVDGTRIYRPSSGMLAAAAATGLPALAFLAAAVTAGSVPKLILFAMPAFILLTLSATALLAWSRFRVQLAPEGLALRWPLRGWRRWRWEALRDVRLERRGGARGGAWIAAEAGAERIRIPGNLVGFSDLVTGLLAEAERHGVRGRDRDA